VIRRALVVAAVVAAVGCSRRAGDGGAVDTTAAEMTRDDECASCGMLVLDQPSPRAQAVHRDGTRVFFCSINDLLTYLAAPSPHGAVKVIYVEVLDPAADPHVTAEDARPWRPAEQATFVVGVERPRVMGRAVLAYATADAARAVAARYHGTVVDWAGLRSTAP